MKKRILFVDDEPTVLKVLRRTLHDRTGVWDMSFATSAAEATELLAQKRYDAIVLDIKMPEKDGLELLAEIKAEARTRDIEVVMLTALEDQSLKRQSLDLGATDLLNKPVIKEDLIARLNSVLRMKSYHDQLQAQNAVLERQLLQSQRMELIGMLAAGVAHDLNDILAVTVMDSDFIEHLMTADPAVQGSLKDIENAGQHAEKILQQICRFSRQTEGERELCNLSPVIDECLELLWFSIPERVVIKWDGPQTNRFVKANVIQMYQMLMNLCINAARAMEHEGVLRISLTETELDADSVPLDHKVHPGRYVRLEVSDTGAEMDQDMLERFFELRERARSTFLLSGLDRAMIEYFFGPLFTPKRELGSTGLGLSVAQRIVRDHRGLITVKSIPGKGTTFLVYLPCAQGRKAPDQAEKDRDD